MNERLIQFLSAENISQAQFADSINVARAGVSHIVAGRNKPGWDFIINTMTRYPTLNIEWLLTGKGKMYKSAVVNDGNSAKKELNSLFDDVNSNEEGRKDGEIFESETVELSDLTPQTAFQSAPQPVSQPAFQPAPQPAQQISPQPASQPAGLPHAGSQYEPQPSSQLSPQTVVKRPNVAKVIVFFDDGTFQECK